MHWDRRSAELAVAHLALLIPRRLYPAKGQVDSWTHWAARFSNSVFPVALGGPAHDQQAGVCQWQVEGLQIAPAAMAEVQCALLSEAQ